MKNMIFFVMGLSLLLFAPVYAFSAQDENVEVTVVERDYVLNICHKYLANPGQCSQVIKVNQLKNADLIHPGQKLRIPVKLLKGVPADAAVTFIKGDVTTRQKGETVWTPLRINAHVPEGASVKTGQESTLELVFEDGTSMFIRANTVIDLYVSRKSLLHFARKLFIGAGSAITRLRAAAGQVKTFEIGTPDAMCAVRGTQFRTSVDKGDSLRAEVLEGRLEVEAMKQAVEVREGEGTLVKKGEPPLAPRKLLFPPAPLGLEPIYKTFPISLGFSKIEGAAAYRIALSRDKGMKDILKEEVMKTDALFEIAGMEDGAYYLQSTSIDSAGLEGIPLEPAVLKVRLNPLPPVMDASGKDLEARQKNMVFSWAKVTDADDYNLQIAEDAGFQSIVSDVHSRDTQYSAALDYKTYFFRIRSIAADGYASAWSDAKRVVLSPPLPAPVLDKPLLESETIWISIRWEDLGPAIRYHFQMAKDSGFSEILVDKKIETPKILLQKPDLPGTYYVRTSSVDANNVEGAFSQPESFEIKGPTVLDHMFGR